MGKMGMGLTMRNDGYYNDKVLPYSSSQLVTSSRRQ